MSEAENSLNLMEKMEERLLKLERQQSGVLEELCRRMRAIEEVNGITYEEDLNGESGPCVRSFSAIAKQKGLGATGVSVDQKLSEASTLIQSKDLKWEYEALRDSVARIKLPLRYRMNDSKAGINAKDKEQAAILVRSGKFIETSLKMLFEAQKNWGNSDQVADCLDGTLTALTAHMRYLQEEHNTLYVSGQYGSQAKAVLKSIQRNTSNLQPEDIEDLKTTVAILPPQPQVVSQGYSQNQNYRGSFRFTNRFRGGFRGRGFRGGTSFQRDFNSGFQHRNIPMNREQFSEGAAMEETN